MDDLDGFEELELPAEEDESQDQEDEIVLATIASVEAGGVKIQIDGESAAGDKVYSTNAQALFVAGDRVKILKNSGTYIVEYVLGTPMARYPIPSGGSGGQVLTKNGANDYAVAWTSKGLPSGGNTGQVLTKSSNNNYDVSWEDSRGMPSGGTTGQILAKSSNNNYAVTWVDAPHGLPAGGTTGQYLKKSSGTNYAVEWGSAPSVSALTSGSATVTFNGSALYPSGNCSLGSSSAAFNGCYLKGSIHIGENYGSYVGFFGKTPVSRQTLYSSSTLANVISALQAYGLG